MPKQLAEFVREKAAAVTETDHLRSIKDRLKNVMDLFKVSRYRPLQQASISRMIPSAVRVGRSPLMGAKSEVERYCARWWGKRQKVIEMAKLEISITC